MPAKLPLLAWPLLFPAISLAAAPPSTRSAPPLPRGAVARFGDPAALWGPTQRLLLSPDVRLLVRHGDDGNQVYDLRTALSTTLPLPPGADVGSVRGFAANGDVILVEKDVVRLITPGSQVRLTQPLGEGMQPGTILLSDDA